MVLTVTLNPAVDKTYRLASLQRGEVNRITSMQSFAGGKGINVSKLLQQFGVRTTATGFLGGFSGKMIEKALEEKKIICDFIHVSGETRSNMNVIAEDGSVTELLEPGPVISEEEQEAFLRKYTELVGKSELVVLSGSAAKGIPSAIYQKLVAISKQEKKKTLLDVSGEFLVQGLKANPYFIKPNQKELEYIVKRELHTLHEITEAATKLQRQGIERVIVSMGKEGFVYIDSNFRYQVKAPKVRTVNTVGCGDSLVASQALSLLWNEAVETGLRKAAAISAANAASEENGVIPMELLEELMQETEIKTI